MNRKSCSKELEYSAEGIQGLFGKTLEIIIIIIFGGEGGFQALFRRSKHCS